MDAAALRSKVTFQKNETIVDEYGNHKNIWNDYYTGEKDEPPKIPDRSKLEKMLPWSNELSEKCRVKRR